MNGFDVVDLVLVAGRLRVLEVSRGCGTLLLGLGNTHRLSLVGTNLESGLAPLKESENGDFGKEWDDDVVADTSTVVVGDRTLDRRQDGTTSDTHDKKTSSATSVTTEVVGTQDEDQRVHDRLEEHDSHAGTDRGHAASGTDDESECHADESVDAEQEGGVDDRQERSTEETTDREEDETVRKVLRSRLVRKVSRLVGQVEEEGTDGNLSTDVAELSDETEGSLGAPEADVLGRGTSENGGSGSLLGFESKVFFRNVRELGEDKGNDDQDTKAKDGKVDELNVLEAGNTLGEEELGCNERADE